jgi:transposase
VRAYSQDLRERVLADCDAGMGTMEVAAKYRVSQSWVRRLKQRRRTTGSIFPKKQRYGRPARWLEHAESLAEIVRETPDIGCGQK